MYVVIAKLLPQINLLINFWVKWKSGCTSVSVVPPNFALSLYTYHIFHIFMFCILQACNE